MTDTVTLVANAGWDPRNDYSAPDMAAPRRWLKTERVQLLDENDQVLYGWRRSL